MDGSRAGPRPTLMPPADNADRRPLKTHGRPVAHAVARWLARHGATPNAISVAGVGVACLASLVELAPGEERDALLGRARAAVVGLRDDG